VAVDLYYALTKFISAAQGVETRKRLQKALYLVQQEGAPVGARYFLYHYGPFSAEVASAVQHLKQAGVLDERVEPRRLGQSYNYGVTREGMKLLEQYEEDHPDETNELTDSADRFAELCEEETWILELAATIVLFKQQQGCDWTEAKKRAADFKRVKADSRPFTNACVLAEKVVRG